MKSLPVVSLLVIVILITQMLFGLSGVNAGSTATIVSVSPEVTNVPTCFGVQVAINIENVADLTAYHLQMSFDPQVIEVLDVSNGTFLEGGTPESTNEIDNTAGTIVFGMEPVATPVNGSGKLVFITLRAVQPDQITTLTIDEMGSTLTGLPDSDPIPFLAINGDFNTMGCVHTFLPITMK